MSQQVIDILKTLIASPDLASKKWIYQQYDSGVMNDTITSKGDAAIVRVRAGKNKALAISTDCTPRYVEADPYEGAIQAVAETYRNISAVGARPLAITNCLNFGNPQKPDIMGQIVRSIKGITEASKVLDYPVVSGNVSLYNETDGAAIQPAPAIGGVGLLKDLTKRCNTKFKQEGDAVFVIGKTTGHINLSLFEREILKIEGGKNPPKVDLLEEKKNGTFVRELIQNNNINACHDISDGGLLVSLFEMCTQDLGCNIDIAKLAADANLEESHFLFAEDQARYVVSVSPSNVETFQTLAKSQSIDVFAVATVIKEKIKIGNEESDVKALQLLNQLTLPQKFS